MAAQTVKLIESEAYRHLLGILQVIYAIKFC